MNKARIQKIQQYFSQQPAVKLAYLYGSQARGEARKNSDIDLAVLFDEQDKNLNTFKSQGQFLMDLSSLLDKKVDVQNLNAVDMQFAYRVISEGKLIYNKNDDNARVDYEFYVTRQYFDLKPLYDEYFSLLEERARQGLVGQNLYKI